jgi:DNA polymerase/3'-5' exonuclease PolX
MQAAELPFDTAGLQPNQRSQLGYKRAATAIVSLPESVADLVATDALREVPYVGPASARIVSEFVADGRSATVDAALARAGRDSSAARALRAGFRSHYAMLRALEARLPMRSLTRAWPASRRHASSIAGATKRWTRGWPSGGSRKDRRHAAGGAGRERAASPRACA